MSPGTVSPLANIKAITCDVFGTVVDWRSSVVEELTLRAYRKLSADIPADLKQRLQGMDESQWGKFAQEWRNSYVAFVREFDAERDEWKSIDEHHRDSLAELLQTWRLDGLYSDTELDSLSLVWHRLNPWPDSADGIRELGQLLTTATLSNGNLALLRDLNDFGNLGYQKLLSAETFRAYKPSPAAYLGAVRELSLEPRQVAMVATHLGDLEAARACGLRTVYIERPQEEAWGREEERYQQARGWVDLWIAEDEDGFRSLARHIADLA